MDEQVETPEVLDLLIQYNTKNGNINVTGPINNKGLCFMILELGKDCIREHCDKLAKQQRIVPVAGNGMEALLKRFRQ